VSGEISGSCFRATPGISLTRTSDSGAFVF